ncbi:MAG: hypothetical protein AAGA54_21770 [Myxococcota bacterium]
MSRAPWLGVVLVLGCDPSPPAADDLDPSALEVANAPQIEALAQLRDEERALRDRPPGRWTDASGPDPFAVRRVGDRIVGLLRNPGALVLLDRSGAELARHDAPAGATGWAWRDTQVDVVGELDGAVRTYRLTQGAFELVAQVDVQAAGLRAVAHGPRGVRFLADRHRGRVLALSSDGATNVVDACPGALDVQVHGRWLLANCMLAHEVRAYPLTARGPDVDGVVVVRHDGPMWSMAARAIDDGLELVLGGVEDHALERRDGTFGYIDSFVFFVDVSAKGATRRAAVNVSAHGVVTPKGLAWSGDEVWVSGAGSDALVALHADDGHLTARRSVPAGLTALDASSLPLLAANPLLDAWVLVEPQRSEVVAVPSAGRDEAVALGEALVTTTLLAPQGQTEGRASRFTCETCHFEGTVDGRVHYTGRDDVYAATKTLRGLVGNHPHFSRALDRSTIDMIHNEFRVANGGTPQDPWFDLRTDDVPWLEHLTSARELTATQLRGAMLAFLAAFEHPVNPSTLGRAQLTELEHRGASRFETLCASCHQPRRVADDPESAASSSRWAAHVFGPGDLLWASAQRVRTGIEPLVHDEGARVPSLRSLWAKRPYFTNGSAETVAAVLQGIRIGTDAVHGAGEGTPLSADDQAALAAFVDLL